MSWRVYESSDEVRSQSVSSSDTSEKELRAEMDFQYGNILFLLGQIDIAIGAYSMLSTLTRLTREFITIGALFMVAKAILITPSRTLVRR